MGTKKSSIDRIAISLVSSSVLLDPKLISRRCVWTLSITLSIFVVSSEWFLNVLMDNNLTLSSSGLCFWLMLLVWSVKTFVKRNDLCHQTWRFSNPKFRCEILEFFSFTKIPYLSWIYIEYLILMDTILRPLFAFWRGWRVALREKKQTNNLTSSETKSNGRICSREEMVRSAQMCDSSVWTCDLSSVGHCAPFHHGHSLSLSPSHFFPPSANFISFVHKQVTSLLNLPSLTIPKIIWSCMSDLSDTP